MNTVLQISCAIMLSEVIGKKFKRITQSVMFLPYFISWVVVGAFIFRLVYAIALRLDMPAFMLKLVSSVIVALAIALPYLKQQWPTIYRRLSYRQAAARKGGG